MNIKKRSRLIRATLSGLGAAVLGLGLMGSTAAVADPSEKTELLFLPEKVTVDCETGKAKVTVIGRGLGDTSHESYLSVKGPSQPTWFPRGSMTKVWKVQDLEVGEYTFTASTTSLYLRAEATLTVGECSEAGPEDPDYSWFDPWVKFDDTGPLFVCDDPASVVIAVGGASLDDIQSVTVREENGGAPIEAQLEVAEDGHEAGFWYVASGLQPGNYTVSMTVNSPDPAVGTVTVEGPMPLTVRGCPAELVGVAFASDTAQNVCPATTANAEVVGKVLGVEATQAVSVAAELYLDKGASFGDDGKLENPDDATLVATGKADVEVVNQAGTFSIPFEGLDAGKYYAKVTVFVDGEEHGWDIATALTVSITDCDKEPEDPDPEKPDPEKPDPDKPHVSKPDAAKPGGGKTDGDKSGSLAKTGATIGFALVAGTAAVGGGILLRRKSK